MSKEERKNREFRFDTVVQGLADDIIKPALPAVFDRLYEKNPTLWFNGAWVYLKAPDEIRRSFVGVLRLAVLGAEWVVDFIKFPHLANDVLEFIAVRVTSQIPDYYNREANKRRFEAVTDFQPLTIDQAKEVARELGVFLFRETREMGIKILRLDPIKRLFGNSGGSDAESFGKLGSPARMFQNLLKGIENPEFLENYWVFFHDWLVRDDDNVNGPWYEKVMPLTSEQKLHWFKRLAPYLDERSEQRPFFGLELEDQVVVFKTGILLKQPEMWPAVRRELEKFGRKAKAKVHAVLTAANTELTSWDRKLVDSNRRRQNQINQRRNRVRTAPPAWHAHRGFPIVLFTFVIMMVIAMFGLLFSHNNPRPTVTSVTEGR